MCLMVWLGTMQPLGEGESDQGGYPRAEVVAVDDPVRARFSAPFVTYVGAHGGCGCGFRSGVLSFDGVVTTDEARTLLDAMTPAERSEFLAEQSSREWLRGLVERAAAWGRVELFTCWANDEGKPVIDERSIAPDWITARTEPFEERVRYVITPE